MAEGSRHLAGGWLLVAPVDAGRVAAGLRLARRAARQDGIGAPPSWLALLAAAEEAESAANGTAALPPAAEVSLSRLDGELTAAEAAVVIGTKVRNVRARAARGSLPGRLVGGVWLFDAVELAAVVRERSA